MANQMVAIAADSNTELEVGNMVDLNFRRMKPNIDNEEDIDVVNSGEYLCTGIKHHIKGAKYSIIVEAQRFGINKERFSVDARNASEPNTEAFNSDEVQVSEEDLELQWAYNRRVTFKIIKK